jgi:hypothetical protein
MVDGDIAVKQQRVMKLVVFCSDETCSQRDCLLVCETMIDIFMRVESSESDNEMRMRTFRFGLFALMWVNETNLKSRNIQKLKTRICFYYLRHPQVAMYSCLTLAGAYVSF